MLLLLSILVAYLYTITIVAVIYVYSYTLFEYVSHNLYLTSFDNRQGVLNRTTAPKEEEEEPEPEGNPWGEEDFDWDWNGPADHSGWEQPSIEELSEQTPTPTSAPDTDLPVTLDLATSPISFTWNPTTLLNQVAHELNQQWQNQQ
jgi:hypothetical protein